jgi:hypothetical protein
VPVLIRVDASDIPTQNYPFPYIHGNTLIKEAKEGPNNPSLARGSLTRRRRSFLPFLAFLLLALLCLDLTFNLSSDSSSGSMLQKAAPKSLIILGEIVGGIVEQPRQFLCLQAEALKPLLAFLIMRLLLTSASLRGVGLDLEALFLLGGVEGS